MRFLIPLEATVDEIVHAARLSGARFGESVPVQIGLTPDLDKHTICEHPLCGFWAPDEEVVDRESCPRCASHGHPTPGKLIPLDAATIPTTGRLLAGSPGVSKGDLLSEQRKATAAAQKAQKAAEQAAAKSLRDAEIARARLAVAEAKLAAKLAEPEPVIDPSVDV